MHRSGHARALRLAPLLVAGALGCGGSSSTAIETTITARPALPPTASSSAPIASALPGGGQPIVSFPERSAIRVPMKARCGAFEVHRDDGEDGAISVTDARRVTVFDARPSQPLETIDVAWCGDIDGDGRPELAFFKTAGGAHCCRTDVVITLDAHPIERLRSEGGNAGGLRAEDVDGDGKLELVSSDDALAERGDVPYAFTLFLPVVFAIEARSGGRWVRSTSRFKAYLGGERRAAQRDLDACNGDATCQLAWAEKIAGVSVLIGDWSDAAAHLTLTPELMRTTSAAAPRIAQILRARGELVP